MNSEALTKFVRERLILKEERRGEDRKGGKVGKGRIKDWVMMFC